MISSKSFVFDNDNITFIWEYDCYNYKIAVSIASLLWETSIKILDLDILDLNSSNLNQGFTFKSSYLISSFKSLSISFAIFVLIISTSLLFSAKITFYTGILLTLLKSYLSTPPPITILVPYFHTPSLSLRISSRELPNNS